MLEILSYILAGEVTGLASKFDGSQYRNGQQLNNNQCKKGGKHCTVHNIHQIKTKQWP